MKTTACARFGRTIRFLLMAVLLFVAVGAVRAEGPVISLTGVMYSQNSPSAYIDGRLMRVGDEVAGYEIIKIRHAGIHVKSKKGTIYYVPVANPAGIKEVESADNIPSEASSIRAAKTMSAGGAESAASSPAELDVDAADDWHAGASVVRTEPEATAETTTSKPAISAGSTVFSVKMYAAMALIVVGALMSVAASIWYLVVCFMESIWWGLGAFFIPFVQLVFLFVHWERAKKPFLLGLLATLMVIGAMFLSPELTEFLYDY